jgi:hypothetical protein
MRRLMRKIRDKAGTNLLDRHRKLVDFVICGTQKGGTSALDAYLRGHPEICMAEYKEVHFFNNESFFADGRPDYAGYHSSFSPGETHRFVGEVTPIYMYWDAAPRRIWEYNPDMKIIVVLRNPIDRAYSHWNMERYRGMEDLPFGEAIRNEEDRCREALPHQHMFHSYVDRGFYTEQLRRLWRYFSREKVLVLRSENLRNRPQETLDRVFAFIGVDSLEIPEVGEVNAHPYLSEMSQADRDHLRFVFEYEIRELERVLGWDCSDWLSG